MFVVLDSNVWVSQLGLNSRNGVEFLELVRRENAVLAVPEVVRLEVETKFWNESKEKISTIQSSHRYLDTLLGEVGEIALPDSEKIKDIVSSLIDKKEEKVEIRHIPLTLEAAKSSFEKIRRKKPPSSKNKEQFADGVIWANCLELLLESDVWLVSMDQHFFKDGNTNEGLAINLEEEARRRPNKLRLFCGLEKLLQKSPDVSRVSEEI